MALFQRIKPPKSWKPVVIVLLGAIFGLGAYIAKVANVASYLTDDPRACINCHVMTPQYITWNHSSHREVASCNDCHVPHDNVIKQYAFKAKDGIYHATIYTLRAEPEAIVMHEAGREAVQNNCIRCHVDQVTDAKMQSWTATHTSDRLERTCWECHRETPHGRVRSLSSVGYHIEPIPIQTERELLIPKWLKEATEPKSTEDE
ncbi:MAG: cytochrome c nitrite reductase small subunit [Cytophagales bacterium]|nr:cytochrome c nitrite reductase small subunit [Cytophagales bacterium]